MMEEMLYLSRHPRISVSSNCTSLSVLDYFMRSAATVHVKQNGSIRDFYIKALSYIEQNFQNDISVEDIFRILRIAEISDFSR